MSPLSRRKKLLYSVFIGIPLAAILSYLSIFYGGGTLEDRIVLHTFDLKPDSLYAAFVVADSMDAYHHFDYEIAGNHLYLKFYSSAFQREYPSPEITINDDFSQIDSIYQVTSQEDILIWTAEEGLIEFRITSGTYTPESLSHISQYDNRSLLFYLLESDGAYTEAAAAELFSRFLSNSSGILEEIADFTSDKQAKICSLLAAYPLDHGLKDKFEVVLYRTDESPSSNLLKDLYEQKKQDPFQKCQR